MTDTAKADLQNIRKHIARKSPAAAIDFTKDLVQQLDKLVKTGATGVSRDWVATGMRGFPYKERCFYFRIVKDKMVVLRILHSKQDVTAQTFPSNSQQ